jgi:hypothetical protein
MTARDLILQILRSRSHASIEQLCALMPERAKAIRPMLSHMVTDRQLERMGRGVYRLARAPEKPAQPKVSTYWGFIRQPTKQQLMGRRA